MWKLVSFLLWTAPLCAETVFVSLGCHCGPADQLRNHNLRCASYPFDWIHSFVHDRFLAILEDDFAFFLDDQMLFPWKGVIENRAYKIEFRHEQEPLDKAKYERRLTRFRALRNSPDKVVFLRTAYSYRNDPDPCWNQEGIDHITPEQALEIQAALRSYFPSLHFELVILNYKETYPDPFPPLEGIIEVKQSESDNSNIYYNVFCKFS